METLAEIAAQANTYYTRALILAREDRCLEANINFLERAIEEAERRLSRLRAKTSKSVSPVYNILTSGKLAQQSRSLRMHTPLFVANIMVLGGFVIKTILGYIAHEKGFS